MPGTPQVHELGGRTVFVLPALPSGGGAADAVGGRDAARGLRQAARRCSRSRCPSSRRRPPSAEPSAPRPERPAPIRDQLDLFGLSDAIESSATAPAETEALGARLAAGPRAGRRGPGQRRAWQRQDDPGPRRLPGARRQGAGDLADLHDRPPLPGRVPISHLDLYRLDDLGGEDPALLDDYLTPDAVAFVEWPEIEGGAPLADGVRVACRVDAPPPRRRPPRGRNQLVS